MNERDFAILFSLSGSIVRLDQLRGSPASIKSLRMVQQKYSFFFSVLILLTFNKFLILALYLLKFSGLIRAQRSTGHSSGSPKFLSD
jgi:hypothetical protein